MKKFSKIGKRVLAFFLVALMNINTYATAASDDGSQFVTKAEFDSLTKEFNKKLDEFQSGMNTKIDEAISGYISGAAGTTMEILPSIINKLNVYDRTFLNNTNSPLPVGGNTTAARVAAFIVKSSGPYKAWTPTAQSNSGGMARVNTGDIGSGTLTWRTDTHTNNTDWKFKLERVEKDGVWCYAPYRGSAKTFRPYMNFSVFGAQCMIGYEYFNDVGGALPYTFSDTGKIPGIRSISVGYYGDNVSDKKVTGFITHSYYATEGSNNYYILRYLPGTAYSDTQKATSYGVLWENRDEFDSTSQYTVTFNNSGTGGLRLFRRDAGTTSASLTDITNCKFIFKGYTNRYYSLGALDWYNISATQNYSEAVKKYNGLPLCTNKVKGDIQIPLNVSTSDTGKCIVAIRKDKWGNEGPGTSATDADVYYNDDASGLLNITISQEDDIPTTYWLKVLPILEEATTVVSLNGDIKCIKKR